MLYVALGRHVFRWPLDRLPMFEALGPAFDDVEDPIPPNPTDAYGCPGKPVPVHAIGMDLAADGSRLTSRDGAAAFAKIGLRSPSLPRGSMVKASEEFFQTVCDGAPTVSPQGFMRCSSDKLSDPNRKRKRASDYLTNFKVPPTVYADPAGNPLYVSCGSDPLSCLVHYELAEELVLQFEFYRGGLKIARLLDFDRALRRLLADAEVKDFVWPDSN